ncbi:MAG: lasso peptide biosynthesis B2 protein [Vicinamibacterales bacterium]
MRILRKFAAYSALERRLVVKAWFAVVAVRILLWVAPYRWIEAWFMAPPAPSTSTDPPAAIALAVTRASTLVPMATCLTQALAAGFLIRRAGRNAIIHFGVARDDAGFKAHAWLESDGGVLIGGREAAAYLPLTRATDARR